MEKREYSEYNVEKRKKPTTTTTDKWQNETTKICTIFIYFEGITECVERSDCRFYFDFNKNGVHSRILKYRWQTLLLPKYLGCATSPSIGIYMYWLEWLCSSFNWIKWLTSRTWVILLLALKHTHTRTHRRA